MKTVWIQCSCCLWSFKRSKNSYPFLRDLKLADSGQNKGKIDLLIGADFDWSVVDGSVKKVDDVGPVALV